MLHKYKPLIFDAKNKDKLLLHQKGTYFYKQKWFNYSIPALCGVALLVGIYLALFPITKPSVNAEEDYGISTQADNSLRLTLGLNPDGNTPSSTSVTAGIVAYREYKFNAYTSNSAGYRIYIQPASGYTNSLVGLANPKETISGVGEETTGSSMAVNTWGYSLETASNSTTATAAGTLANRKYKSVPMSANGTNMVGSAYYAASATNASGQNFSLAFAANIGGTKPADHYQTKILVSLAARAASVVGLSDKSITEMQQVTPDVCEATTPIGYTKRLADKRDGRKYWVAKLADGNCWMTQNLAYDTGYSGDFSFGATTTNVTSAPSVTIGVTRYSGTATDWGTLASKAKIYVPGAYVYTTPTTRTDCGVVPTFTTCTSHGWQDVSGKTASESEMTNVINGSYYDAHYLVGNYYSWAMATLGTGNNLAGGTSAPDSICPAGWRLPIGNSTGNGSFHGLLAAYGIAPETSITTGTANSTTLAKPLYFLYGGDLLGHESNDAGYLHNPGGNGYYWTSTLSSGVNAYWLGFSTIVYSINGGYVRQAGVPIRCVATSA